MGMEQYRRAVASEIAVKAVELMERGELNEVNFKRVVATGVIKGVLSGGDYVELKGAYGWGICMGAGYYTLEEVVGSKGGLGDWERVVYEVYGELKAEGYGGGLLEEYGCEN